jgi:serine/threonine protein kinase
MLNQQIQNYRIISLIGEGGMGDVYLAEHVAIKRKVAIKVLKPELVKNEEIRLRFKNEASMLAHLQHPNIVGLIDYVEQDGGLFLIMEYVEGQGLDELVKAQKVPISIERAKKLMIQIVEAFIYAHKSGIIHRDVKPSNILVTADDQIKVLDFGIAKLVGDGNHQLTKTGTQIGTVYYMSPEQVRGQVLDHRSDIYSLGVTFYELLTGVCPYKSLTTEYEIYDRIVKEPLLDLTQTMGNAYRSMWTIISKATAKDVSDRYQSCEELAADLNKGIVLTPKANPSKQAASSVNSAQTLTEAKPKSKTWLWITLGLLAAGLGIFLAVWFFKAEPENKWHIEQGYLSEGKEYSVNYAFYKVDEGELLPYQRKVNDLVEEFVIKNSFVKDTLSFQKDSISVEFLQRLLSVSKSDAEIECQDIEYGSELHDSISIDTNFVKFDQVKMYMFGYMCGGTGWQAAEYKLVDRETAKVLGLQDIISNIEIFTGIAEIQFRKQYGLGSVGTDFGDEFTFENDQFYCPKNFYIENGNFTFSYDKYEVASGAAGNLPFSVPISEISHLLTYDISSKLKNQRVVEPETKVEKGDIDIIQFIDGDCSDYDQETAEYSETYLCNSALFENESMSGLCSFEGDNYKKIRIKGSGEQLRLEIRESTVSDRLIQLEDDLSITGELIIDLDSYLSVGGSIWTIKIYQGEEILFEHIKTTEGCD